MLILRTRSPHVTWWVEIISVASPFQAKGILNEEGSRSVSSQSDLQTLGSLPHRETKNRTHIKTIRNCSCTKQSQICLTKPNLISISMPDTISQYTSKAASQPITSQNHSTGFVSRFSRTERGVKIAQFACLYVTHGSLTFVILN
jgi:hypothetical protein